MTFQSPGASVIILYNKEGKMLLEHRAETRKRFPGCWMLFGGRVEEGETPEATIYRETKEELNYTLSHPVHLMTQKLNTGEKYVFVEQYDEKQHFTLLPPESQGYGWYTFEEWQQLDKTTDHDEEPLRKAQEYIRTQLSIA